MNRRASPLRPVAFALLFVSAAATAFELPELQRDPPVTGDFRSGYRWPTQAATVHINVFVQPGEPDWNQAFREAADRWNDVAPFEFTIGSDSTPECLDDEISVAAFRTTTCSGAPINPGQNMGRTVLALTLLRFIPNVYAEPTANRGGIAELVEVDILFNEEVDWTVFSGANTGNQQDFRRVATHELGHAIGLAHEDDVGVAAIMSSGVGRTEFPQSDDLKGVAARYNVGDPEAPPAACETPGSIGVPATTTVTVLGTCAVRDFLTSETSYQPAFRYNLSVAEGGLLRISSNASEFGTRLGLYDAASGALLSESSGFASGSLTASTSRVLQPGSYFLLVSGEELGADGTVDLATEVLPIGAVIAPILSTLIDE